MLTKIILLKNTIKHLTIKQLSYQLLYRVGKKAFFQKNCVAPSISFLNFPNTLVIDTKCFRGNKFRFLNLEKDFGDDINWNFSDFGKLWTYNLEYFDFLNQKDIPKHYSEALISSFYTFSKVNARILEPYPVSLRVINIIRFLSKEKIEDNNISNSIYEELCFLNRNLEFHILGNHLLENLFALFQGSVFFGVKEWEEKAKKLLVSELNEQILEDGCHFELSPMYQNIIFYRLLELIDWYQFYEKRNADLLSYFREKASLMLSYIENIKFSNGDFPLFNDAAFNITYTSSQLIDYARDLDISNLNVPLSTSGYRFFHVGCYEIAIDGAQIGASYQPGHAHADALSFILYYDGRPLFVEQGTSTYQIGSRRALERSTEAHNTIVVNDKNQSEVWGGFRVGRRAKTVINYESSNFLDISHDGYNAQGVTHRREFKFLDDVIVIQDSLSKKVSAKAYIHLHPKTTLEQLTESTFRINEHHIINFDGAINIKIEKYQFSDQYNVYKDSNRIVIELLKDLKTTIKFIT